MTTLKLYTVLLIAVSSFACKMQEQPPLEKIFAVETRAIKLDTVVTSAVYLDGRIICLLADQKLFVLDTFFKKDSLLTARFSNLKADLLFLYNDTILVGTYNALYFLDTNYTLKDYSLQPFRYQIPVYNDDTNYVYACSAGEWGGSVFFWNKNNNKTYSYPSNSVQQVFKFNDTYVISNYLAHMGGFSSYLFIKEPENLYELKDEVQKTTCNWYIQIDSLRNINFYKKTTSHAVLYYEDTFSTRTLLTFPHNKELYSIYCTDSVTVLAKFQDWKLIPIDTLLNTSVVFYNANTHLAGDKIVTAYNATWAVGGEGNTSTPYQNAGLIFIQGNKITFVEFDMPHKWVENNGK